MSQKLKWGYANTARKMYRQGTESASGNPSGSSEKQLTRIQIDDLKGRIVTNSDWVLRRTLLNRGWTLAMLEKRLKKPFVPRPSRVLYQVSGRKGVAAMEQEPEVHEERCSNIERRFGYKTLIK